MELNEAEDDEIAKELRRLSFRLLLLRPVHSGDHTSPIDVWKALRDLRLEILSFEYACGRERTFDICKERISRFMEMERPITDDDIRFLARNIEVDMFYRL